MKLATKTLLTCTAAAAVVGSAQAATIEQFDTYADGNTGGTVTADSIAFDVVNTNSILVATLYVDAADGAAGFTSVTFGGVAPDATYEDKRTYSFVFLNPSTAGSLTFDFAKTDAGGVAAALYEVTGAKLDAVTVTTGSTTIETTTADELVISFYGENGSPKNTLSASIFGDDGAEVLNGGPIRGGGALSAASAIAPSIGTQNLSWDPFADGQINYAFENVPEPGSLALLGLGGLLIGARRRRA